MKKVVDELHTVIQLRISNRKKALPESETCTF